MLSCTREDNEPLSCSNSVFKSQRDLFANACFFPIPISRLIIVIAVAAASVDVAPVNLYFVDALGLVVFVY